MLMQYWFPFRGVFHRFDWYPALEIQILVSCKAWMLFWKKNQKKKKLFFLFVCVWLVRMSFDKTKKNSPFFELALQKRFFFWKKSNLLRNLLQRKKRKLFPEPKQKEKKAFLSLWKIFIRTKQNKKAKSLFSFIFLLKHSIWSQ